MKPIRSLATIRTVLLAITAIVLAAAAAPSAQAADVDLTAYLKANSDKGANYTYYALGNFNAAYNGITAVDSLTMPFLPGYNNATFSEGGSTTKSSATFDSVNSKFVFDNTAAVSQGALSFSSGKLTNGRVDDFVSGFAGALSPSGSFGNNVTGTFHILFDLGANYNLTSVDVAWRDSSGHRWGVTTDQKVYTATSLDKGVAGFSLLGSNAFDPTNITAVNGNKDGTTAFAASESGIVARYVLLEITVTVGTNNSGTWGGNLSEVTFMGSSTTPIPEPATTAVVFGAISVLAVAVITGCVRRRRQRQ